MPSVPKTLPRLCVALGFPSIGELGSAAEREYKDGTTFLEFRLDHLKSPRDGVAFIRKFCSAHSDAHVLVTCRGHVAHGGFRGQFDEQAAILKASTQAGAAFVDLEIEAAENRKAIVQQLREAAVLMISYHNFESTPSLEVILRRLAKVPADIYKIATTARKPTDNLRVMELLQRHESAHLVALAMSDIGTASRILTPSAGAVFTYAAPVDAPGTASGQIPAHTLRSLYRSEKLSRQTRVYGVIADPVSHSKSPFIHNRAFQARRFDAVYLPFLVSQRNLSDWMHFAAKLPVAGFSVTIPHKRRIVGYLDAVDPLARRIGAVNTVWRKNGKWRGSNTDAEGVLTPLRRHLRPAKASVLIAGYGGAARAAAVALYEARAQVTVTGRNTAAAKKLAAVVKGEAVTLEQAQTRKFDVLIQATPVGMFPRVDETLFAGAIPAEVVFDMVYNPRETLLLKQAREQGCTIIAGSEMLLEQAASQFELWSGESAPREIMRTALEAHL